MSRGIECRHDMIVVIDMVDTMIEEMFTCADYRLV